MEGLLGRLAVHYKMISIEQLAKATRFQARKRDGRRLGQVLVEMGYIDFDQLNELLSLQKRYLKLGAGKPTQVIHPVTLGESSIEDDPILNALKAAIQQGASDLHLQSDESPHLRQHGQLFSLGAAPRAERLEKGLLSLLSEEDLKQLKEQGQLEWIYELEHLGRFRASCYHHHRGLGASFHLLPPKPPNLIELKLPGRLAQLSNFDQGLLLITGPRGSGKTSTLAALIQIINEEREAHIITIEDPIEFCFAEGRALIDQRELGRHTHSYARAIRSALRAGPDVIALGDLCEPESIILALEAAEAGHLVMATHESLNFNETLSHLTQAFSNTEQQHARIRLGDSLQAVLSQRLLLSSHENMLIPACGLIYVTPAVGTLIREGQLDQLPAILRQTRQSQLLDDSLERLVSSTRITQQEARRQAEAPEQFGA